MGVRFRYFREKERLLEFWNKYKNEEIAITTHKNADTDAIASAILLSLMFPKSKLYIQDKMNFPAARLIEWLFKKFNALFEFKKLSESKERLLIVVDTSGNAETYGKELIGLFDHHDPRGARLRAKYEFRNENAPANAILILEALLSTGVRLPVWAYDVAAIALISDTNRFDRADPDTFYVMAELLNNSISGYEELRSVALPAPDKRDLARIELLLGGRAKFFDLTLESLERDRNIRIRSLQENIPYVVLDQNLNPIAILQKIPRTTHLSPGDVTSDIKSVFRTPFVIFIKEVEPNTFRLSIRTSYPYNAVSFMRTYVDCKEGNCGGHERAGGGTFNMEEKELIYRIIKGILTEISKNTPHKK